MSLLGADGHTAGGNLKQDEFIKRLEKAKDDEISRVRKEVEKWQTAHAKLSLIMEKDVSQLKGHIETLENQIKAQKTEKVNLTAELREKEKELVSFRKDMHAYKSNVSRVFICGVLLELTIDESNIMNFQNRLTKWKRALVKWKIWRSRIRDTNNNASR